MLSDRSSDRAPLRRALEELGHLVLFDASGPQGLSAEDWRDIDLLIEIGSREDSARGVAACFHLHIEADFLARSRTAFEPWKQNLRQCIARARRPLGDLTSAARAERVWLLAASAGGPAAVAQFLSAVPRAAGLGLLYAQHIDPGHLDQLQRWLGRDSDWRVGIATATDFLLEGSLALIHPQRRLRLRPGAELRILSGGWPEPYRPNIDQLAENLALAYRERAGMIVFGGLGDDGVLGSQHIREQGGEVWVQDPSDCVARAMPEAVIAGGGADYIGALPALARRFRHRHPPAADRRQRAGRDDMALPLMAEAR
jgi:chemotaxis response regulator CheB